MKSLGRRTTFLNNNGHIWCGNVPCNWSHDSWLKSWVNKYHPLIYYTFYLMKISIFLFFNYFSLFTQNCYSLFLVFSLPSTTWPWQKKEKEKPTATIVHCMRQSQLLTVWVQSHSHNCFSLPFPTRPWQKNKEKREAYSHNCWLCECNHTATIAFHHLFPRDPDKK